MQIEIMTNERAFLVEDGRPVKYLVPGVHRVWAAFKEQRVEKISTVGLLAELDELRLALVPAGDLQVISLAQHERGLVMKRGKAALWLNAGVHQIWTVDRQVDRATGAVTPLIEVKVFDTSAVEARPLTADVVALAKGRDYVEATAPEGHVAVRYVDGQLDAVLPAGRHAAWNTMRTVTLSVIDLRERVLAVNGQDVMTKDRVSLRLNLSATFKVKDAKRLAVVARVPDDVVYLAMQLAAREAVTTRTLDELLGLRDELSKVMTLSVRDRAEGVGLELIELGVKDVILPGEMKDLLNKVIQAQKEAEANVILRREETAATRSMAQTAKVLSENPLLVRLKELEAYKELAAKVGQVHLVLGDGALDKLQLKA
jgi:regulator of protease activity HflC (stomatin/prohibitin superfamily)